MPQNNHLRQQRDPSDADEGSDYQTYAAVAMLLVGAAAFGLWLNRVSDWSRRQCFVAFQLAALIVIAKTICLTIAARHFARKSGGNYGGAVRAGVQIGGSLVVLDVVMLWARALMVYAGMISQNGRGPRGSVAFQLLVFAFITIIVVRIILRGDSGLAWLVGAGNIFLNVAILLLGALLVYAVSNGGVKLVANGGDSAVLSQSDTRPEVDSDEDRQIMQRIKEGPPFVVALGEWKRQFVPITENDRKIAKVVEDLHDGGATEIYLEETLDRSNAQGRIVGKAYIQLPHDPQKRADICKIAAEFDRQTSRSIRMPTASEHFLSLDLGEEHMK